MDEDSIGKQIEYRIARLNTYRSFGVFFVLCFLGYIIITSFRDVAIHAPEQMCQIVKIVDALSLDRWIIGAIAAVTSTGYIYERKGKKRAIREKSKLQKRLENNDPGRTSSHLTETGDTPEE